jgi:hypothetical protein
MPAEAKEKTTTGAVATENQATENQALESFEWDSGENADFFGIKNTAVAPDEVAQVIKEMKAEEAGGPKEQEEEEEEESMSFFGVKAEEDEEGETVLKEVGETTEDDRSYKSIISKMKEAKIFQNVEIPEGEEITDDKFIELQDLEIESRVDEAFESFFSELDEDAAAFLKHKKDGGNTSDFFKVYGQNTGIPTGDLDDESYQEKVSRYYYKNIEGDESEDIDSKIEWLKDSGKLEKFAQKFDQKIKDNEKTQKEGLAKTAKEGAKADEAAKQAFVSSVQAALDSIEQVDNFTFTKESKKSLLPFITKPTVKVGKNQYVTGMQSKLNTALKNPEKMLVLAQLLQNDFDISGVINDADTVKTKKLKSEIQRKKTSVKPSSSGRVATKRGLADFF